MATQNITISSVTPVMLLTSANQNVSTVANLDATHSVYLSSDPIGGAGAFELTAGSVISWDRLQALYAYVTGAAVKMVVLDNGGNFNNGVAVANALMSSGLAHSIATEIVASALASNTAADTAVQIAASTLAADTANHVESSTLSADIANLIAASALAANTATNINGQGVPPIDVPTSLGTASLSYPAQTTVNLNCAKYNSVTIFASLSGGGPTAKLATVQFSIPGFTLAEYDFVVPLNGSIILTVPAEGSQLAINYLDITGLSTLYVSAVGSYKNVSGPSYRTSTGSPMDMTAVSSLGNGTVCCTYDTFTWTLTSPNFSNTAYLIPMSRSGTLNYVIRNDGSAGVVEYGLKDYRSGAWIVPRAQINPGYNGISSVNIAYRPIMLHLICSSVTGPVTLSMTTGD